MAYQALGLGTTVGDGTGDTLRDGGYLLASDYFVHFRDGTKNPHLKSSHDMEKYLSSAKAHGFELIREYDQTENTMPTLDYGKYFIERFINPTVEYGVYSAKKNYPKTAAIIGKMIGSKISSNHEGTVNILKGTLNIDHGTLVGGQFSIDMQSLATTDMSEAYNKKLDGHLKDEDFFVSIIYEGKSYICYEDMRGEHNVGLDQIFLTEDTHPNKFFNRVLYDSIIKKLKEKGTI